VQASSGAGWAGPQAHKPKKKIAFGSSGVNVLFSFLFHLG